MIPYRAYPRMLGLLLVMSAIASIPVNRVEAIGIQQPGVVARSTEERKAEADQFLQQGIQQYQTSQVTAALQSWEKALQIYRELKDQRSEGLSLGFLGLAYDALGNYGKAIEYQQQRLAIAREIKNRRVEGDVLEILGLAYDALGDYDKAIDYQQQSLAIAREIKNRRGEGSALGNLGLAYDALGDYGKAIEYQQQSLAIAREIKDRRGEAKALGNLGITYDALGNYDKAIEYQQQSLAIAREIKDRRGEAKALGNLGVAYDALGDYGKAIEYQQQSLAIAREIKDRRGEGSALGNLGITYKALGNYDKAIDYQQQSLAIAREIKNRRGEAKALGYLVAAYKAIGNDSKAIEYQQQWLALMTVRQAEADQLLDQGTQQHKISQFKAALQSFEKALQIYREINDRFGEGWSLGSLGLAYFSLGDYAKAIDSHEQSLAIKRALKDRLGEGVSLGNLGSIYYILGDYAKALDYYKQSLTIKRALKDRLGEGHSLGNLGLTYNTLGDYAKALDYYKQSLAILQELKDRLGEGQILGNLGLTHDSLGDYGKAIEYQQLWLAIAREIKDRRGEANALGNIGGAYYSLGDYGKAIEYQQLWLAIAREIKDRRGEANALGDIGLALFRSGKLMEAESPLLAAIQVYESLRRGLSDTNKVNIADIQRNPYRTLQQVLIAQNKKYAALEIAERGRARAFLEQLAKRVQGTEQPTLSPIHIADIQQVAQAQNATLVEYSQIYDGLLFIWVVKPTGEVAFRKVDLKLLKQQHTTLTELVTNSRQGIGVSDRSDRASARIALTPEYLQQLREQQSRYLQQLHQLLIEPIADLLPTDPTAHVIFLPQGELFLVPFAALQDKSNQYLIQQHTIAIAPAIQVLQLTHQQRQTNQPTTAKSLVAGNPVMPQVKLPGQDLPLYLPYLPGAEEEAIAVAKTLNTTALLGNQATKKAIVQQMKTARIIHLATHGLLDDFKGLGVPGAIALAPDGTGQPNDGLLTSDDILDMKLKAELVVLSACNTGEGRITGDGVIGLSRSLITAGVPSVMVSLWEVPDAPTAALMTEFYQQLQRNPNKAAALRQAMLKTIQTHPEPKNWAAFILIGETK